MRRLRFILAAGWFLLAGCYAEHPTASGPSDSADTLGVESEAATAPGNAVLSIVALAAVSLSAAELLLPVSVQLHNPGKETIQLIAGTPCAVFRWHITAADSAEVIQREPNELCIQVVASGELRPGDTESQRHQLALDPALYRRGEYVLHYRFWGYAGEWEFAVED